MKPFKSLTLRIWSTFAVFATLIIFAISCIYLGFAHSLEKNAKLEALSLSHDFMVALNEGTSSPQAMPKESTDENKGPFDNKEFNQIRHLTLHYDTATLKLSALSLMPKHPPNENQDVTTLGPWFYTYLENHKLLNSNLDDQYFEGTFENKKIFFRATKLSSIPDFFIISYVFYMPRNNTLYYFLLIGLLFIIIALIASKIISASIVKPLKQLETQALKIAQKNWIPPIEITREDEIGRLMRTINYMQKSLQEADLEERQFLQSISHDLKTPIMVIAAHAQAIIDGMYIDSVENTADIIKMEAFRLEEKVKQILYFNTLDYALTNEAATEHIALDSLLTDLVSHFAPLDTHIKWQITLMPAILMGNKERLQTALENILENQCRFAKKLIRIVLRVDEGFVSLHIFNDGPPIDEKDLPHIFKEGYKGANGHFGLGLAITKKIIVFYGGSIAALNEAQGVCFQIKLPLTPAIF